MISRNHVRLELRDDVLLVTDVSTNGTVVRSRIVAVHGGRRGPPRRRPAVSAQALGHGRAARRRRGGPGRPEPDQVSRAGPGSVMGDAPTISMRPPLYRWRHGSTVRT